MIFGNRRYSHSRACVSILTLAVYLATMLPPRSAEADPSGTFGIAQGTGGAGSLDGPQPQAGSTESLASVDLSTGSATSSYPFQLPTARGLAQPSLSLTYSSSAGIGFAGMGWTLDVPSIERRGASGMPQYDTDVVAASTFSDRYVFNGQPLVPLCTVGTGSSRGSVLCGNTINESFPASLTGWTYFHTEIDNGMRFFSSPDMNTWQVQTKTGVTMTFGAPGDTLVGSTLPVEMMHDALATTATAGTAGTQYRWNLSRQTDQMGNVVAYVWMRPEFNPSGGVDPVANQGREYLTDIYDTLAPGFTGTSGAEASFAHHTHLNWTLPTPLNPLLALSPSWRTPQSLNLVNVDVTSAPISGGARQILRRYWLGYQTLDSWEPSESNTQQYLSSIQLEGACGNQTESQTNFVLPAATNCPMQPKLTMTYQAPVLSLTAGGPNGQLSAPVLLVDTNGDSIPEEINSAGTVNPGTTGSVATAANLFVTTYPGMVALGDWNGGGIPEWLWLNSNAYDNGTSKNLYELYAGSGNPVNFTALQAPTPLPPTVSPTSNNTFDLNSQRAMDIDGDGYTDMGLVPNLAGTYDNNVWSFFTQHDGTGKITPFGRRVPKSCVNGLIYGQGGYSHATHRVVTDADGDGLEDVVVLENTKPSIQGQSAFGYVTAHIYKNRGDGRFGGPDPAAPSCANDAYGSYDIQLSTGGGIDDYSFGLPSASMHDVDGDGLADFVWVDPNGLWVVPTRRDSTGVLEGGTGPMLNATPAQLGCSTDASTGKTYDPYNQTVLFGDATGDGLDSIYAYVCNQLSTFHLTDSHGPGVRPGLLSSVSNGLGVTTTISYDSIYHAVSAHIPVTGQVVTEVKTTNSLTGPYAASLDTTYKYDSPVYDARDRQFLGFQNVIQTQHGASSSAPAVNSTTHFATGTCPSSATAPCPYAADYGWRIQRGLVAAVETSESAGADASGRRLTTTVNTYDYTTAYSGTDGRMVRRVNLAQTDEYLWDSSPTAASAPITVLQQSPGVPGPYGFSTTNIAIPGSNFGHKQHQYQVDGKGNPSWDLDLGLINRAAPATGQPAQPADVPILKTTSWGLPPSDPSGWNWKPLQASTSYANSSGTPSGQARTLNFYYYGSGLLHTISSTLTGTKPLVLNQGVLPSDQSVEGSTITLTTLNYNQWGDVTQVIRPGGSAGTQCTAFDYDTAFEQLPADSYQYTGSNCGGAYLQTSFTYDRGFEQITGTMSPSGKMSTSLLDAFGRVTRTYQNDPSLPAQTSASPTMTVDYSQFDTAGPVRMVATQTLAADASYRTDFGYYDGFGRRLVTLGQTEIALQYTVSGASQLDPVTGRALTTCAPFFASSYNVQGPLPACQSKSMVYDGLGRVTQVTDELSRVTKIAYSPETLSQKVQNAKQLASSGAAASTVVVSDGHGRVVQRVDNVTTPSADAIATTYTYLATGEVTQIARTHTAGTDSYTRTMTYDTLGRRVTTFEPNSSFSRSIKTPPYIVSGQWVYAYNDAGELVGASDARGCGETLQYDTLGRPLGEDYHPCASGQAIYSTPNWSTGAGLESRYVYDTPEVTSPTPIVYKGKLTATYDRAQHSQFTLDARGRVTAVKRQIAEPIGPTWANPYAPYYFTRGFTYDDADHIVGATTGTDVAALMPGGTSSVGTQYNVRGGIDQVTMSYGNGTLLNSRTFGPSGETLTSVFADASNVTQDRTYNADGTLARLHTHRNAGPWAAKTATYTPPAASDPAAIGELQDLNFTNYDGALNPGKISDAATGAWPTGSLPVTRSLKYDDLNRLTSATIGYGSAGTATDAYNEPYQPEMAKADHSFPPPVAPATTQTRTRPASQTFAYDWLGNITSSDDDLHISPDRSFGTATYPAASSYGPNQLTSATQTTEGGTTISAYYDNAGNTISIQLVHVGPCYSGPCATDYQYSWDEVGRLSSAERFEGTTISSSTAKVTFQYLYTAQGERVLKQETNASVVSYDVNVFPSLRVQTNLLDGNNDYTRNESTETVFLQDGAGEVYGRALYPAGSVPSATGNAVHVYLELGNHLGSTAFVIDYDSGELVDGTSDLVYGAVDSDMRTLRWNYFRADYRYTGHEDEAEVGLSYMGQRFYIPMLARFASPDPVSIHAAEGDLDPYAYVHGSPLARVDPVGLCDDPNSPSCQQSNNGALGNLFNAPSEIANWIGNYNTNPQRGGGGMYRAWTPRIVGMPLTQTPMVYTPYYGPTLVEASDFAWTAGNYVAMGVVVLMAALAVGSSGVVAASLFEGLGPAAYIAFANAAPAVADAGLSISQGGILTGTAVAGGAVLVAEEGAPTVSKLAYYLAQVEKLDVSTAESQAVFYSGPGNRALAEAFAAENGGRTLEMTPGGAWLDSQKLFAEDSPLTVQEALEVWSRLSQRYAEGASGNVVGFVQGARAGGIFNTVEYPALIRPSSPVTNVITGGF